MKQVYLAVILLYATSACQQAPLSKEELIAFVSNEDNGLKKSADAGNTKVEVTYRPTDLMVEQELDDEVADTIKVNTLRKKYDRYYYFILSLSSNNKETLHQTGGEEYSELVQTLSFRMAQYVSITTSAQDTIPVSDFILNRTYGLGSSTDMLFAFSKEKAVGKDWLQFNLNELGLGFGNQRFRFRVEDLRHVPNLEFNTNKEGV